MAISLSKALKAPFEKGFLIPCLVLYGFSGAFYILQNQTSSLAQNALFVLGLICQIILLGYHLSFAHNALNQNSSLFATSVKQVLVYGLKSLIFGLLCYVFLAIMAVPIYIMALIKAPFWIAGFVLIFESLFAFLYLMAAWTKFTDTTNILQPIRLIDTINLLALNWRTYLKTTLYMIVSTLILVIPLFIFKLASALTVYYFYPFFCIHLFIMAVAILYPTFVILHLMAQGYIQIKEKISASITKTDILPQPTTIKIQPVNKKGAKIKSAKKTPATKKSKSVKKVTK